MKIHKKNRILPFILTGLIVLSSFFLFSSFIFPKGSSEDGAISQLPETPENQNNDGEPDHSTAPPQSQQTYSNSRDNLQEREGGKGMNEEESTKKPTSHPLKGETEANWDEHLLEELSFLQIPLPGAGITTRDTQLPGAPRPYRHGVHEGLDFYSGYCGIEVSFGDPVYAAGSGVIYRIDHDYIELPMAEREEMLQICKEEGDTPESILDMLRGRQVWIIHSPDLVTRYAHLSEVAEHLQEGDRIEAGDYLGNVGNSGTSSGAAGKKTDSHLHFEIWLEDSYLGKGLTSQEVRSLWKALLEKDN